MTYPGIEEPVGVAAATAAPSVTPAATPTAPPPPADPYGLKAWGPKFQHVEFDIVCPSGQRCRARQLKMEDAMALGILESLDLFTPTVMSGPEKPDDDDAANMVLSGLSDPERRSVFFGTVNKVVAHTVVIPKIVLVDDGNLPEGTIFANDIPFADKMHIFREVFSSRGDALQSFREGQEGDVAPVEAESGVPMPTE